MEKVTNGKPVRKNAEKTKVLRFSDLVYKLQKRLNLLAQDPKALKSTIDKAFDTLEKLETLRKKKMIRLDLEIPRKLAKKLGKVEVLKVNGIIRNLGDGALVELLADIQPSGFQKLVKIKNISFLALDVVEAILVDRKLTDISETVDHIDKKLDAQNRGALKSALQQMKELSAIQDPEIKRNKILLLQDRFSLCEHLFDQLYQDQYRQCSELLEKSGNSTFSNKSKLTRLCRIGNQLPELLEPVILCKIAQIRLYQMQGELALAQEKAFELADYGADRLLEFKYHFSSSFFEGKTYKNIADFNPGKTIDTLKEKLVKPNEHMDYIINCILGFALTVPSEKKQENSSGSAILTGRRSHIMLEKSTFKAPLSKLVKGITAMVLAILSACIIIGLTTGPGGALIWDIPMVVVPALILVICCFFAVTGYALTPDCLYVNRPGWSKRIPLESLTSVEVVPKAMEGALRAMGNGGFFVISGKFRNTKLGKFTAYVTHQTRCIVLKFSSGPPIVISPSNTQRFVEEIKQLRNIR